MTSYQGEFFSNYGLMRHDLTKLSLREAQILRLMASQHTNEAMASQLSVSERMIQSYQQRIISTFNFRDETELLTLAKSVYL